MSEINYKHIAIEGCIGAGKTELAQQLHNDLGGDIILEHFAENKFLPLFYQDPKMYGFHVELTFLTDRYAQILSYQELLKKRANFVISDYFFDKSFIFSDNNLEGAELKLYRKLFHFLHDNLQKPNIVLYLYKHADSLLRNIQKRGRPYEQNIQKHYLKKIQAKYLAYLENVTDYPVLLLNTDALDFVSNQSDYDFIKHLLSEEYECKNHRLYF
ncbi:MAG: deoxynucleoside kinase [Bacteroidales bacterium]|jgi:deoxyadenosine/deoxycytidine kinase|nr:deoxynucleoside kinase [Bacteroidales bacterium]